MKNILITAFIIVLACSGCNKESFTNPDLINKQWNLVSIVNSKTNDQILFPTALHNPEHITFTDSTQMDVRGICNAGNGRYSISSRQNSIRIGGISSTFI